MATSAVSYLLALAGKGASSLTITPISTMPSIWLNQHLASQTLGLPPFVCACLCILRWNDPQDPDTDVVDASHGVSPFHPRRTRTQLSTEPFLPASHCRRHGLRGACLGCTISPSPQCFPSPPAQRAFVIHRARDRNRCNPNSRARRAGVCGGFRARRALAASRSRVPVPDGVSAPTEARHARALASRVDRRTLGRDCRPRCRPRGASGR